MGGTHSQQIVLQRVRNRLIEYLDLESSFEAQRGFEIRIQISVPAEVINQWEDWVPERIPSPFHPPVFSPEEAQVLTSFHEVWTRVAESIPNPLPPLEETLLLPQWENLRSAAAMALEVLMKRGPLPEDEEITSSV